MKILPYVLALTCTSCLATSGDIQRIADKQRERAELDHVGPGAHHAVHQRGRDVGEGKAGGDVGDEGFAAGGGERREGRGDAAHGILCSGLTLPLTCWPWHDGRQ